MGGSCLISGCPHSEREDVCDTVYIKVDRVLGSNLLGTVSGGDYATLSKSINLKLSLRQDFFFGTMYEVMNCQCFLIFISRILAYRPFSAKKE